RDTLRDRVDAPHATEHLCDVQVPGAVERDAGRKIQARLRRDLTVEAAGDRRAAAGHGGDDAAGRIHAPYPMVVPLRDVEITRRTQHAPEGAGAERLCGGPAVAPEAGDSSACDGLDDPGHSVDAAHTVVLGVGDEDVAMAVRRDVEG